MKVYSLGFFKKKVYSLAEKIISLFRHGTYGRMAKQKILWTRLLEIIVRSMKFHGAST